MSEPDNVLLGLLRIEDGLEHQPHASPGPAHTGRELTVRLPYEYRHHGKNWDGYKVVLRTWLDGRMKETQLEAHRHHKFQGNRFGFLEVKYEAMKAGRHSLRYEIDADFSEGPHGHPELDEGAHLHQEGTLDFQAYG